MKSLSPEEAAAPSRPDEVPPRARRIRLSRLAPLAAALCGLGLCLVVGLILLDNARSAVREELHSAFLTTRDHVAMRLPPPFSARDTLGEAILLAEEIDSRRHVSALVAGPNGAPLSRRAQTEEEEEAPAWFVRLLTPEVERTSFPITHYPNVLGVLHLASDPQDEIAEVWEDFRVVLPALALTGLTLLIFATLFNLFALSRIRNVTAAVARMRGGDFSARAPEGRLEELAVLAEGVNALARHLEAERAQNAQLQARLLHLSEAERARIASDLHDEIGPQIFGLQAALSQARALLRAAPETAAPLAEALEAVGRHAEAVRKGARVAMADLRPMAAGHASLVELLQEQAADFMESHPGLTISLEADPAFPAGDEMREIAVYRFVRESVLNAIRHGGASHVRIELRAKPAAGEEPRAALARVSDDGRGPAQGRPSPKLGHLGMRDRAQALGAVWTPPRRLEGLTVTELRTPF